MDASQYFIAKTDKYILVHRIGKRNFQIVSDKDLTTIELIYQKICSNIYGSQQELFEDIFRIYRNRTIIDSFRNEQMLYGDDIMKI